jgi:hypothetical protein
MRVFHEVDVSEARSDNSQTKQPRKSLSVLFHESDLLGKLPEPTVTE